MRFGQSDPRPTPLSLEYVAGLFDGEGNLSIHGTNIKRDRINERGQRRFTDYIRWRIGASITNTNADICARLRHQFGGSLYHVGRPPTANWKPAVRWSLSGCVAAKFIESILPALVIKREQAEVFLRYTATLQRPGQHTLPEDIISLRCDLYHQLRHLNSKGNSAVPASKLALPDPRFKTMTCADCGRATKVTVGVFDYKQRTASGEAFHFCQSCYISRIRSGKILKSRDARTGRFS